MILNGVLNLNNDEWCIGIIERDVPCADLAFRDFEMLLKNILKLEGKSRKQPNIKYQIFTTSEFSGCQLNSDLETDSYPLPKKSYQFDLLMDISVLQRKGLSKIEEPFADKVISKNIITIRSSYSQSVPRLINSARPIQYVVEDKEQPEALVYFHRLFLEKINSEKAR